MATQPVKRRFTADEYQRMGEAGIFGEDDRVELLDGEVVEMTPIGRSHAAAVRRIGWLLTSLVRGEAIVDYQNPLQLDPYSEPQPDLMLLKPRADFYLAHHPTPEDVLLLVEIADTSLAYDRTLKARLYARAGIREVWLINLPEETVAVYRDPTPSGYQSVRTLVRGESIAPLAFADREVAIADLLG